MSCNCPKCSYTSTPTPAEPQRLINTAVEEIQQKLALNNDNDNDNDKPLSPAEFAKMTNNQPKILVDELINVYCELTWKMQDIKIPVKDTATTAISNQAYISIPAPGTVVKFDNRRYFYSCPSVMMSFEGSWISDESTSYSTYEFLREVLDNGGCVELVLEG